MNLFKSTTTFSFFTIISRILGYIRDILIAIFLGSGPLADAFFVAFRIPNTFRRLFSEGTFNAAFVPSYASELANGKDQSEKFATNVFSLLIISLFFLVLVIEIFIMLCFSIAFFKLTPSSFALYSLLVISSIDSLFFIILGRNKYRISVSSKAIVIADREVQVIYFKGLRKISIHQQSVFFEYIEDIQLFFPLNSLEEKDVSVFFNELNKLIDRERVYLGNTHKFIKK